MTRMTWPKDKVGPSAPLQTRNLHWNLTWMRPMKRPDRLVQKWKHNPKKKMAIIWTQKQEKNGDTMTEAGQYHVNTRCNLIKSRKKAEQRLSAVSLICAGWHINASKRIINERHCHIGLRRSHPKYIRHNSSAASLAGVTGVAQCAPPPLPCDVVDSNLSMASKRWNNSGKKKSSRPCCL